MSFVAAAASLPHADVRVRITVSSSDGTSIAELGVLLTGLNRALNEWLVNESAFRGKEPTTVRARITSVAEGSVIVDALLEFFESQVASPNFLGSMLANAGHELLGKVAGQIKKALSKTKDPNTTGIGVRVDPVYLEGPALLPKHEPDVSFPVIVDEKIGDPSRGERTVTVDLTIGTAALEEHKLRVVATVHVQLAQDRRILDLWGCLGC